MSDQPPSSPARPVLPGYSRRNVLGSACVGLAAWALSGTGVFAAADASGGLAPFMKLSGQLTGQSDLNPTIGKRLYQVLSQQNPNLDQQVQDLLQHWSEIATWTPQRQAQASTIVKSWFTGVAPGGGPNGTLVTYEGALMFSVVNYRLIRTYCAGAPGSWAAKPDGDFI